MRRNESCGRRLLPCSLSLSSKRKSMPDLWRFGNLRNGRINETKRILHHYDPAHTSERFVGALANLDQGLKCTPQWRSLATFWKQQPWVQVTLSPPKKNKRVGVVCHPRSPRTAVHPPTALPVRATLRARFNRAAAGQQQQQSSSSSAAAAGCTPHEATSLVQ